MTDPPIRTSTVTLVDGVRVVVPDSLDLISPYVLLEQEDWFEEEIKLLRRLLKPGQNVIDIGANYGVYTLSMARTVGPEGRVWAFEPASSTAELLAQSIAANGFPQVVLERCALSASSGTADLLLDRSSELNALVRGEAATGPVETVTVTTLDECMERHGWRDIHFVKIDAEGEEANILKGAERFFAELSPLVQFEIKAVEDLHLELVDRFAALGYRSYRLVPGLDLLIPFDAGSQHDGFLLNLFCCKPDRAADLAAARYLLDEQSSIHGGSDPVDGTATGNAYDWRRTLSRLPYGARLADLWERTMAEGKSAEVDRALALYASSRDEALPLRKRFDALKAALNLLGSVCVRDPSHLRLATFARVARDYGARSLAVRALGQLCEGIMKHQRADLSEPFLSPCARFESVSPGNEMGRWILASALEELEKLAAFSSFYTGVSARPRLEAIRDLGFGSPEMARRLSLLQKRFGSG